MAKTKVLTDVGVSALVDETKKYVRSQGIGLTEDDINGLIDTKLVSVNESIENKVEKEDGKSLSTNDYTTIEKEKLATISEGAEVNVQSDWNETDDTSDAFIKNKPTSLPANGGNADSATKLATARTIDGVSFNGSAAITHYGTCSTAAGTAAKTVSLTGFTLVTGASVKVKFTVTNTASSPTLNVNSTGAKAIMYRGSTISTGYLAANRVYEFVYDGTDWELVGDINTDSNTTYSQATSDKLGLVKIGYAESGKNYPVELNDSGQMYVNVPWTDNNTTYSNFVKSGSGAKAGLVPAPSTTAGTTKYLREDGTWQVPPNTDTNTKNTAGSTNTSSKLFLIGATSQAANPQTYSHDTVYVGTDGCLYSNSTRVVTEVISTSEPTGQVNGDYWLLEY